MRQQKQINVKWALTLLHFAVWLQLKKTKQWENEKQLLPKAATKKTDDSYVKNLFAHGTDDDGVPLLLMILTGAGGTSKSTTIRMLSAFADFWMGVDSLQKSAPTNTAARVNEGDTCHALYKLPFGTL